jgi:hypothetical protein
VLTVFLVREPHRLKILAEDEIQRLLQQKVGADDWR